MMMMEINTSTKRQVHHSRSAVHPDVVSHSNSSSKTDKGQSGGNSHSHSHSKLPNSNSNPDSDNNPNQNHRHDSSGSDKKTMDSFPSKSKSFHGGNIKGTLNGNNGSNGHLSNGFHGNGHIHNLNGSYSGSNNASNKNGESNRDRRNDKYSQYAMSSSPPSATAAAVSAVKQKSPKSFHGRCGSGDIGAAGASRNGSHGNNSDGNGNGNGNGNSDPLEERPEHWVTASEIVDEENSPSVVVDVPSAMMIAAGGGATSPNVPREERPRQASIRSGSRTRRRLFGNVPPLFSNLSSTLSSLRHHHQRQRQQQRQTPDHHSLTHRTHSSIGSMDGSGSEIWTGASHSLRSSNSTIDSHPSVPSYHGRGVPGMAGARGGVAGTTEDEDEDGSDTSSWAVIDLLGRRKWYAARIVKVAFGVVALAALMGSVLYLVLEEEEVGGGDGWVGPSLFSRSSSKNALFGDWFVSVEDEGMNSGGTGGGGGGGGNGARAMMNGDALMLPHDEGYERDARHEDLRLARRRERERWRKEERMKGRREEHIASQQRGVVHP